MRLTFVVRRFFVYFGWATLCDLAAESGWLLIILVGGVSEKSLFAPELRIFFDFSDRPWRAFRGRFAKKVAFFCSKYLQGINSCLIFASPNKKWWIHLRARIRASHARHRGSNPLSTTKQSRRQSVVCFCFVPMACVQAHAIASNQSSLRLALLLTRKGIAHREKGLSR